ncbi:MAG: radical SAM protein [Thermoanaerobaculia bacterium]
MIAFGPIPSRRLGFSLGINNIPSKRCSYACVYCQAGPTPRTETLRSPFYDPEELFEAVRQRVEECRTQGQPLDYLSFVPDGEPTLDVNLGEEIRRVKTLGIPVAVITNGSLLWVPSVRADLAHADLVSVEIDTTSDPVWRLIDRPSPEVSLPTILNGIEIFAAEFKGELMTQTMLVGGINDRPEVVADTAAFLRRIRPHRAFLSIPTRPPADPHLRPPDDETVRRAWEIMSEQVPTLELMTSREQGAFGRTGNAVDDLLGMLTVHPMRLEDVEHYLTDGGEEQGRLEDLITAGRVKRVEYRDAIFIVKQLESPVLSS